MISQAKRSANRRNSRSSTGPRTDKGKAASRQNALKHGLAGKGLVLDPCDQLVVLKRYPEFLRDMAPRHLCEFLMVHRLAVASVQMDAATRQIHVNQIDNIRDASRNWNLDREAKVQALVARLEEDPKGAVAALERSTHGCAWLLERWEELTPSLRDPGEWTEAESLLVHRMTGLSLATLRDDEDFDHVALVDAESARLEALDEQLWEEFDGPHFAHAEARAYWDHSPHGDLMRRYEKAAERLFFRTLSEIRKSKSEPLGAGSKPSVSARQPDVYAGLKAIGLPVPPSKPSPAPAPSPAAPRIEARPVSAPSIVPQRVEIKPVSAPQRNEAKSEILSVSALTAATTVAAPASKPAAAETNPSPTSRPSSSPSPRAVDPRRKQQDQARKARRAAKAARKKQRARR